MVKPILFSTEMVRAILEGRKSVTRRPVKPWPSANMNTLYRKDGTDLWRTPGENCWLEFRAPCVPGDVLWVRETWAAWSPTYGAVPRLIYKADGDAPAGVEWRPSIHMPREAARIFLQVKEVRVERLQDCGNAQAKDEGCTCCSQFVRVWNNTIKPADCDRYGWEANPWVWVIEFERCRKPEGWPG